MATHRRKKAAGETVAAEPRSLQAMVERYLEWMRVKAYSEQTVDGFQQTLLRFCAWCEERAVRRPSEVTKPILERYQRHLFHYRKSDGQPLSTASQYAHLASLRGFFKWLCKENHILFNPAAELELPRARSLLPDVLSVEEVEKVLAVVDIADLLGVRDRAILETFYSTGIRRMELIALELHDIDARRGIVTVRQGKGKKGRVVPIGERALLWLDKYLVEARPSLLVRPGEQRLFLSTKGEAFTLNHLTRLVAGYVEAAGLGKRGACHLFRHSMATSMLENGADVRFIQELLGHESLATTQVYTRVSIRKLKEVHTATHPARLTRTARSDGAAAVEESHEAEELLSSLAAEAADEEDSDR